MSDERSDIASPCCGICRIDKPSQLCVGCLRTMDEITRWVTMDSAQKRVVLLACRERQRRCSGGGTE